MAPRIEVRADAAKAIRDRAMKVTKPFLKAAATAPDTAKAPKGGLVSSADADTHRAVADLCSRLDAIVTEEDQFHPVGCSTWWEEARVAVDMAKDFIRQAASPSQTRTVSVADLRVIAAAYEIVPALGDTRSLRTIISAPPPARHHNLCGLEYHLKERGMIADERTTRNSGFLLSDGTYADRHRACEVAISAGQVTAEAMTVQGTLFSEDLW